MHRSAAASPDLVFRHRSGHSNVGGFALRQQRDWPSEGRRRVSDLGKMQTRCGPSARVEGAWTHVAGCAWLDACRPRTQLALLSARALGACPSLRTMSLGEASLYLAPMQSLPSDSSRGPISRSNDALSPRRTAGAEVHWFGAIVPGNNPLSRPSVLCAYQGGKTAGLDVCSPSWLPAKPAPDKWLAYARCSGLRWPAETDMAQRLSSTRQILPRSANAAFGRSSMHPSHAAGRFSPPLRHCPPRPLIGGLSTPHSSPTSPHRLSLAPSSFRWRQASLCSQASLFYCAHWYPAITLSEAKAECMAEP